MTLAGGVERERGASRSQIKETAGDKTWGR